MLVVSTTLVGVALIATTSLPLGFGTNDDIALKSLASGRYTGQPEFQLIYPTPVFGLLLKSLFEFAPNFDWYTFVLFLTQTVAIATVTTSVMRKQPISVRVLVGAVSFLIFPRFLFPMQFTGAAILATMAGMIVVLQQLSNRKNFYFWGGLALLALGISLRWEAGLLTVGIFSGPLLLATWKKEYFTRTGLSSSILAIGSAILLNLSLNAINLPVRSLHADMVRIQSIIDGKSENEDLPQLSGTAHDLLRETGGFYWDRELGTELLSPESTNNYSVRDGLQRATSLVISRPYAIFVCISILLILFAFSRGFMWGLRNILAVSLGFIGVIAASSYLSEAYGRLPYRLLMPIWIGLIITQISALTVEFPDIAATRIQTRRRRMTEYRVRLGILLKKLHVATVIVGVVCSLLLGCRYIFFYGSRQSDLRAALDTKLENARCLASSQKMVFVMVTDYATVPSGDLVPSTSDKVLDFPIFDNGWLLHSNLFHKRLDYFKITRSDSIVRMLVLNGATVVSKKPTADLLAKLHNEENPQNPVEIEPILGCEIEAYTLRPATD
jgi:hypothetical protein